MKKLSIIGAMLVSLFAGVATTSCEDMLTVDTGDKIYENANDTLYSYLGILRKLQNVAERQIILGEIRGDLVSSTEYVTDTLYAISNFDDPADGTCSMLSIRDYYNVINNCNLYIANADTSLVKSNKKYMLPEYRQVQAIRAWTYLQLVKNYGEVPFIVEPVTSLDVIDNFDTSNSSNWVNKDNLVDKFLEIGLDEYAESDNDLPSYGSYDNGSASISARMCFIPARLVLGDMYLLRGASESDYRNAATYYYNYLYADLSHLAYVPYQYVSLTKSNMATDGYISSSISSNAESWGAGAGTYTHSYTRDVISLIPSSANSQFGTILSRPSNIYGYTTSSSQSSEVTTDDDGNEEASTSGAITVTRTHERQFTPSSSYRGLSDAQTYVYYDSNEKREENDWGDARINYATESITYDGDSYSLCAKAAKGSTFYYSIPIYRKTVVWLRLAEAINRAGFPRFAFAILKDGLNSENIPTFGTRTITSTIVDENGEEVEKIDTVSTIVYNTNGAMYYADSTEIRDFFLSFNDNTWNRNYGIHARGCGHSLVSDETNNNYITSNITGYKDSISYTLDALLADQSVDFETASEADIINAVENIIVDELALESSFEGNRFTDLVRIADHKNNAGYDGTSWLAAKIADRDVRNDKENPEVVIGTRDENIYQKLLNKSNWYFTKPAWK